MVDQIFNNKEIWNKLSETLLHKENFGAKVAARAVVWWENDKPSKTVTGKILFLTK